LHDGQVVRFERLEILHTDARGFKNLFESEAPVLTGFLESLADGGCHGEQYELAKKRNITSAPSNGSELVMS
jgi:hypothetical protein